MQIGDLILTPLFVWRLQVETEALQQIHLIVVIKWNQQEFKHLEKKLDH